MKTNRRNFFRLAGVTGAGMLTGSLSSCATPTNGKPSVLATIEEAANKAHNQQFNMSGYAAPKIDTVRIGFIGLGMRGPGAVERMAHIEGVEIKALCDKNMDRVTEAQKILANYGLPEAKAFGGNEEAWKEMCKSDRLRKVINIY